MKRRPNILLICTDQQRYDALGAYGNRVIHTPNLDRLASEGALFEGAMTPCPLCLPARASVMTGLTAGRLSSLENISPSGIDTRDTIAGILHSVGYQCQAIGKMHFSNTPYAESYGMEGMILSEETRGVRTAATRDSIVFDDYDRYLMEHHLWGWDKPTEIGYNEIKPVTNPLPKEHHVTQWCGRTTVEWLKTKRAKDKPFFLWTSFVKPHVPYDCPAHLTDLYDWRDMPEAAPGISGNPYMDSYIEGKEFDLYSEVARKKAIANYYANITFIDEQIGHILQTLQEEALSDSTVVIFTSDHGDMLGDHGLWYKCFGYEGSMHVPLLMRWPNHIQSGERCCEIVSLLDLFPTLLEIAGVDSTTRGRNGHDLVRILSKEESSDFAFSEVMFPPEYMCHVRTKRWKYLFYQNGGYEELFDLSVDPQESMNLACDPRYLETRKVLKRKAEEWIQMNGDICRVLDERGNLRVAPFSPYHECSAKPFSRMPWDLRVPPSMLPASQVKDIFWKHPKSDWSEFIHD